MTEQDANPYAPPPMASVGESSKPSRKLERPPVVIYGLLAIQSVLTIQLLVAALWLRLFAWGVHGDAPETTPEWFTYIMNSAGWGVFGAWLGALVILLTIARRPIGWKVRVFVILLAGAMDGAVLFAFHVCVLPYSDVFREGF